MLSDDIKLLETRYGFSFNVVYGKAWQRIKAFVEAQNTACNTQRYAIIAEAVEAWREWDAMPDKMLSDRLVNSMHALSELYPQ